MKRPHPLLVTLAVFVLSGCASTSPDSADPRTADEIAADIGFRVAAGMEPEGQRGPLQNAIDENRRKRERALAELQQRVEQLEHAGPTAASDSGTNPPPQHRTTDATSPRMKLGMVFASDGDLSTSLQRVLMAASANHAVSIVDSGAITEELKKIGCDPLSGDCTETLAVYPGVHLLAVIKGLQATDNALRATIELVEPDTGATLQVFSTTIQTKQGQLSAADLRPLAERLLLTAADHGKNTPWTTRAFDHQGDRWFLAAGSASGLRDGDVLDIRAAGTWLKSPAGTPVAWVPGEIKGQLRVDALVGRDVAAATLLKGQGPGPNDPLTLRR